MLTLRIMTHEQRAAIKESIKLHSFCIIYTCIHDALVIKRSEIYYRSDIAKRTHIALARHLVIVVVSDRFMCSEFVFDEVDDIFLK
jgi:stress-induced morphogen